MLTSDCVKATALPQRSAVERLVVPKKGNGSPENDATRAGSIFARCSSAFAFEMMRSTGISTSLPVLYRSSSAIASLNASIQRWANSLP